MHTIYSGRAIPEIGSYAAVVAGGGFAGVSAAIMAARQGIRVALIERTSRVGGTAVLAGVPNFCTSGGPLENGNPLWSEILSDMRAHKAIGAENGFEEKYNESIHTRDFGFSAPVMECVLLRIALESGVDILFQTDIIDAISENGEIKRVIIQNESLHQAVSGKMFVDATGDGILSMLAGGQSLPNDDAGNFEPIPPAFRIFMHKKDVNAAPAAQGGALENGYKASKRADGAMTLKINLTRDSTLTADTRNDSETRIRNGVLDAVNDFSKVYGGDYCFDGTPEKMPIRESRRIRGDYVLTVDDARGGARFDDAVANCNFIIDTVHRHEVVPEYQIPYRCLLVKGARNLLVAGRCFSADRGAMSSARTMTTACLLGQAAGAAAAIAVKRGVALREVSAKEIVAVARTLSD